MPTPVDVTFLSIAGVGTIYVTRTGTAEREPDGQGKSRWRFATAPMEPDDYDALVVVAGAPSGAESERAWNGTLLTDRPTPAVSGSAMGASAIDCEITITGASYRHFEDQTTGELRYRYVVALTLREA